MASKAIITQAPYYDVQPYLFENKNFITYNDINECVEKTVGLYTGHAAILSMMATNQQYYQNHLRPDMLLQDTLDVVFDKQW